MTKVEAIKKLQERIEELERENRKLHEKLARAKNPEPVQRPTFERVKRLAQNACMEVERHKNGGFILKFGRMKHWYRKLKTLWEIFTRCEWELSELFPPKKVLAPIPKSPRFQRNPSLVFPARPQQQSWWTNEFIPFS